MISWTALGMALVHFVWQGAIIALLLFIAMRWIRPARLRHGIAVAAMILMIASFAATLLASIPATETALRPVTTGANLVDNPARAWQGQAKSWKALLPWMSGVWICGVLLLAGYRAGGWWTTRKLRREGICKASSEWQARMRLLERRIGLSQPVRWFESGLVQAPMVLGWLRPVLLTPVGMLTAMPVSQVESILLHELAHLYRRDPLVNLLQTVVESLLFYHPAVWWVSGVIRQEREHCCDDLVVALQGNARDYARALLTLEEKRATRLEPVLAANGGDLMERIQRLAGHREEPKSLGGAMVLVVVGCLAAFGQTSSEAWLTQDVAYIIKDNEKQTFRELKTDAQREKFIAEFWAKRDPSPATPDKNEFKDEHYRRIGYANQKFATKIEGWKTDRGRVYITYGP
ncbi:MAG: GWxTD domain-containing protein, partial [Acidobacteria bacterium]|nr:GWxTD domain-containing protein [Acidobacteriota bacterium]